MRFIKEFNDIKNKKVLLRVDFNVPLKDGKIADDFRIRAHKDTIDHLCNNGAVVALVCHLGDDKSFKPFVPAVGKMLGRPVAFIDDSLAPRTFLDEASSGSVFLLENVRMHTGEKKNDAEFAKRLAEGFDIYVNDAFSVSHRAHASVDAVAGVLPAYAGLLIEKETANLNEVVSMPKGEKVILLGGAKVKTKAPLIADLLKAHDKALIGGAVANVLFAARGIRIGASLSGDKELLGGLDTDSEGLVMPEDIVVSGATDGSGSVRVQETGDVADGEYILDIGPKSAERYAELVKAASAVIWNGSMGLVEVEAFADGSRKVLDALVERKPYSVIGGGDVIAFLKSCNKLKDITYVSTGGGAMLEFLAGRELPGLIALNKH